MSSVIDFLFGKPQPKTPVNPVTSEELQKETANEVEKIKAETSLIEARTEYAKAKAKYESVMSKMPRQNTGFASLLAKKYTWYIGTGLLFLIIIIAKVT
jgi:hypothetical protein